MTKPRELTPLEKRIIQAQIVANKAIEKTTNKRLFKWHSEAVIVIKDQIIARKKLGFKNDWKVKFLEEKLHGKIPVISKLRKLIQ